jgi:hypothetical protein
MMPSSLMSVSFAHVFDAWKCCGYWSEVCPLDTEMGSRYIVSAVVQMQNGGPHSSSSWGGFSRTTSFHSTMSSAGDYGWAGDHGHSTVDDSDDLV